MSANQWDAKVQPKGPLSNQLHGKSNLVDHLRQSGRIARYFTPSEQVGICERLALPIPDSAEMEEFKQNGDSFKASQKKGRDSRFKVDVTSGYQFTCALTGYRLETTDGYIVQAAHPAS